MISLLLALALAAPDRSAPPAVTPSPLLAMPEREVRELHPGLTLHVLHVPGVRRVTVDILLHQGAVALTGRLDPRATMFGNTWGLASERFDAPDLEDLLARNDIQLAADLGDETSRVGVSVPAEGLDPAVDVAIDVLLHPVFDTKDVRRAARDTLLDLELGAPHEPRRLLRNAAAATWFAPDDPRSGGLDARAVLKVKARDLHDLHARLLANTPVDVLVVGDLDVEALAARLTTDLAGVGAPVPPAPRVGARTPGSPRVVGVDVPEQDQAWLLVSLPAPTLEDPDAPAYSAVTHALGGHFLSRLNLLLREEKGWTYGSSGRWMPDDADGRWVFVVDVAEKDAADALDATLGEITRMATGGPNDAELTASRAAERSDWNLALATADDAAGIWRWHVLDGWTVERSRAWTEAALRVDAPAAAAVAARWFGSEDRLIVIAGDRTALDAPLRELLGATVPWHRADEAAQGRLVPVEADE